LFLRLNGLNYNCQNSAIKNSGVFHSVNKRLFHE
jgi:hypothetical protein